MAAVWVPKHRYGGEGRDARLGQDVVLRRVGRCLRDVRVADSPFRSLGIDHLRAGEADGDWRRFSSAPTLPCAVPSVPTAVENAATAAAALNALSTLRLLRASPVVLAMATEPPTVSFVPSLLTNTENEDLRVEDVDRRGGRIPCSALTDRSTACVSLDVGHGGPPAG